MLRRIEVDAIKLNTIFSTPVFFEDGKNMFLAAGKAVKPYHVAALKNWNVPFLMTEGQAIEETEGSNIERMAGFDKKRMERMGAAKLEPAQDDGLEELEEI